MNTPKFASIQDEASRLSPMVTITANATAGPIDQTATYTPGGDGTPSSLYMNVPALKTSAGNETYTVKVQESNDNSTWVDISPAVPITTTGPVSFGIFVKRRYQQIVLALGGTAPSMTYEAFLNFAV